jgi:hypothetical protein
MYDSGSWANLHFALRRILIPLVHLGRHRSAAVLLGGVSTPTMASPDTRNVLPRARASLAEALGAELERLIDDGRSLTARELAHLALDEIDGQLP